MKILVLGGTAWLGHQIAKAAVDEGHAVTCVARGDGVPDGAVSIRADRDDVDALAPVRTAKWDAVIDVGTEPGHVRRAVRDLRSVADMYLFVSTVSVYASQTPIGVDEDAELMEPLQTDAVQKPDDYGPAKVACENAVVAAFGPDRSLIARSGLIGGPGDPTGRTDYWPWRFAHPSRPGTVLVPDAPDLPTAIVDVRDFAAWLVRSAEGQVAGIFNVLGPTLLFPDHIQAARDAAHSTAVPVEVPEAWLIEREVHEWAGPRSMPLWLTDRSWYGMNSRSIERALAAGLHFRPLVETLRDSLEWRSSSFGEDNRAAGLDVDDELALLEARPSR